MDEAKDEIEALRMIFEEELVVDGEDSDSIVVTKKVRPSNEGDCSSSASVLVQFSLSEAYPASRPHVTLTNPRGISDSDFSDLERRVEERLRESEGMPVMFEILQLCSDFLLEHQHSESLLCPICLESLSTSSVTSTKCDHYVHKECMEEHKFQARSQLADILEATPAHMHNSVNRSLLCPVCREAIEDDIEPLSSRERSKKRRSTKELAQNLDLRSWRRQQEDLKVIFEKQKRNGGIIDLEEERKKNLLTEDTVVVLSQPEAILTTKTENSKSNTVPDSQLPTSAAALRSEAVIRKETTGPPVKENNNRRGDHRRGRGHNQRRGLGHVHESGHGTLQAHNGPNVHPHQHHRPRGHGHERNFYSRRGGFNKNRKEHTKAEEAVKMSTNSTSADPSSAENA